MNTYYLKPEHLAWCKELAMKRSGSMGHANTCHSKNCMKDRPGWWRHFIGVIGELVISWRCSFEVDTQTIGRGDSGSDFPGGIQVKASDLSYEPNLVVSVDEWARKPAQVYVLVWIRDELSRASIMGFITRDKADSVKLLVDGGIKPFWFIHRKHLSPIDDLITKPLHQPTNMSTPFNL